MSINNNIWEIAEAYLSGSLSEADLNELNTRIGSDSAFAAEFQESVDLISSMQGSGKQKRFRSMLHDIHEKQMVQAPVKKATLIKLPAQFWRTAAVAASVAILTSTITIWSLKPVIKKSDSQYSTISREVEHLKKMQAGQQAEQKQIRDIITKNNKPAPPPSDVRYTGTGFAINNDGYFVTAYHVINNDGNGYGDSVYIQNKDGQYFKATLVNFDAKSDVAIMKVEKKNFHFGKGEVPYTFAEDKAGLGISIYTLGYPTDDLVYDEGYISSKNGFQGNAGQYTLQLAVGHGQSGSPVIDEEGNMLGILTAIGRQGESNTYAVSSKAIISLIHSACNDKTIHLPKINRLGNMSREEQIEKMEAYTFSVKVYKK